MCSKTFSPVLDSIVVSIPACHAGDPGSIPGRGAFFFVFFSFFHLLLFQGFCKGAQGAFVAFDVTDDKPFDGVLKWKNEIDTKVSNTIPIVLLANKACFNYEKLILSRLMSVCCSLISLTLSQRTTLNN